MRTAVFFLIFLLAEPVGALCHGISSNPTDSGRFVTIGGIRQWISVYSNRPDAPVILFLHGGPGNPPTGTALEALKSLRSRLTVVVWHQRNSGKTLKENPTVSPVAVDRMFRDAVEMVERLSAEYHQPSIYVLGHSWGGYLALRLAGLFPDRVRACFAMSPMIHQEKSERLTLDSLQEWASRNRSDAIDELKEIRIPFHSYRSLNLHRKWMAVMAGNSPPDEKFVREWSGQWLETFVEASRTDISKVHPEMKCPVFFLIGQKDLQTHFRLAEDYFRTLRASHKELIWFEKSGHAPHRTESAKFRETIFRLTGN